MYLAVLNILSGRSTSILLLAVAVICSLSACTTNEVLLNSDRIEQTFGSYGVAVLLSEPLRRESSLYSAAGPEKTTRTYAVVNFPDQPASAYAGEHARIVAGESIGATFRRTGWSIDKRHLFIGELELPGTYAYIGELMRITLPETLATHVYLLIVSKDESSFTYATIAEIHHPAYLSAADLKEIYGEIIFDDSNRDSIRDFIGAPNPPK